MNSKPAASSAPSPAPSQRDALIRLAWSLVAIAAGYTVLTGLIYLCESLGAAFGRRGVGIAGLTLDVLLLLGLVAWLGRRGSHWTGVLGPFAALLVVILFFALGDLYINQLEGNFWSLQNLRTVAAQTGTVAVAALGMTMIIIAGGIDLSAGTAIALSATVMAVSLQEGCSPLVSVLACVGTGVACGLLNGSLVSLLKIVPFIVTLGTMSAILGVANLLAKETTVRPPIESVQWIKGMVTASLPPERQWLAWPLLPNFCYGFWLALLLSVLAAAILQGTVLGRHVFAVGSNESTARLCGVSVSRVKIAVYAIAGAFVGTAGVYQFARLTSGSPTSGVGLELEVIAAVVIGGGSLSGGRGSIVGTLCGAAIMQTIDSGCTAMDLRNPIQKIIIGAIIVGAVALDRVRQSRLG